MFSEPVIGKDFFGREAILELLSKRVSALKDGYRQNVALSGQSLAGKSSIILHFLSTIESEGLIPIYVEVIKEPFKMFADKFIATMLYNALIKTGKQPSIDLGRLLEKSRDALPKTYSAVRHINSLVDRNDADEAYSELLALTSILKSETGIPCIVILDEFDNLEYLGIKNPFLSFGKVIMVQKDTMYIVSSSRDVAIRKIISEKLSLLFGNFEILKVTNFDRKASRRFIDMKLSGFDMDECLKVFLATFSDGNPFYLDKLTSHAKTIAIERMTSHIDRSVVSRAIIELVYKATGAIHQYIMNFILDILETKSRESYLAILVALAGGNNKYQDIARSLKMKQRELLKNLLRMTELGLVSKNGAFYRIDDVMLEFWLKYVYQRRRDLLVSGTYDKTALFTDEAIAYISSFEGELNKDIANRIFELFNLFSNELVNIDTKNIRLPHFTKIEVKTLSGSSPFIIASFRGNFWLAKAYDTVVSENEIIDYIRDVKSFGQKVSNRIIIPLKGIDENARLLAKELKMSIWDSDVVNMLFGYYGKKRTIIS